jgi:NAD(P) transhydrogenase subunit alpha
MKIGILKERDEKRVALVPETIKKLVSESNEVLAEKGCGEASMISDALYEEAGAKIGSRDEVLKTSDMICNIHPLQKDELSRMAPGCVYISSFMPFVDLDKTEEANGAKLTVFSLDMIPRITIAQSMDILSSMASIAGYKAVIQAADHLPRYFPMLTTAAGSIPPAKVLVLGAGVAGLQAIATAKRLGSVVEAFDTRLAAKEEVESLGARFVEVEGAQDDKGAGGYAVEQTEEYKQKQRQLIHDKASKSDVIITTAQLRGKPAPLLITEAMVKEMKPGSVIVDLATSTGGNCEISEDNKTVQKHGVTIIGNSELAAEVSMHASQLYSKNIYNFLRVFLKEGKVELDMENEIVKSSCIATEGEILFGKS